MRRSSAAHRLVARVEAEGPLERVQRPVDVLGPALPDLGHPPQVAVAQRASPARAAARRPGRTRPRPTCCRQPEPPAPAAAWRPVRPVSSSSSTSSIISSGQLHRGGVLGGPVLLDQGRPAATGGPRCPRSRAPGGRRSGRRGRPAADPSASPRPGPPPGRRSPPCCRRRSCAAKRCASTPRASSQRPVDLGQAADLRARVLVVGQQGKRPQVLVQRRRRDRSAAARAPRPACAAAPALSAGLGPARATWA